MATTYTIAESKYDATRTAIFAFKEPVESYYKLEKTLHTGVKAEKGRHQDSYRGSYRILTASNGDKFKMFSDNSCLSF
jgi:hypothetical protein